MSFQIFVEISRKKVLEYFETLKYHFFLTELSGDWVHKSAFSTIFSSSGSSMSRTWVRTKKEYGLRVKPDM
jgi:hypothetical protein